MQGSEQVRDLQEQLNDPAQDLQELLNELVQDLQEQQKEQQQDLQGKQKNPDPHILKDQVINPGLLFRIEAVVPKVRVPGVFQDQDPVNPAADLQGLLQEVQADHHLEDLPIDLQEQEEEGS